MNTVLSISISGEDKIQISITLKGEHISEYISAFRQSLAAFGFNEATINKYLINEQKV